MSSAWRGVCATPFSAVAKSYPQIGQRHKLTVSSELTFSDHLGEINLIPKQGHIAECRSVAMSLLYLCYILIIDIFPCFGSIICSVSLIANKKAASGYPPMHESKKGAGAFGTEVRGCQ
jgi:hypothetical protein